MERPETGFFYRLWQFHGLYFVCYNLNILIIRVQIFLLIV